MQCKMHLREISRTPGLKLKNCFFQTAESSIFLSMKSKKANTTFRKKVYSKLDSSPLSGSIPPPSSFAASAAPKKIIPTSATKGLREDCKKTFLPLLIDVFELRQMIENYKSQAESPLPIGKVTQSPHEILESLEQLRCDIEETMRWCEGVLLQISKGFEEASEAFEMIEEKDSEQGLLKKLLKKWKR